ncbi:MULTISPECIES: hypothetical protein [unclassified Sphingomonas]|uniref:hypothetical protein n=1 Tax=unclassified Sphingomonas TaxID=196159 RepID=UPI0010F80194|nr:MULTISPECIES: hypothetical protein [unclassified Sphingomonas]
MRRHLLLATSLLLPSFAHAADWYEGSSKHFIVYSEGSPEQVTAATEALERFDQALRTITGTPDKPISPNLRVTVFMLDDVAAIRKLSGDQSIAGYFQPRASGPMAFAPRKTAGELSARAILQHEYAHSFMFSSWPSAVFAKWFVEGFAEFVGTATYRTDGTLTFGAPPEYRKYGISQINQIPASQLLMLNPGKLDELQTHILYGRGWLLTHYALLGGHGKELAEYITLSNAGKAAEAGRAFGNPNDLDHKLNRYISGTTLPLLRLSREQVAVGKVTLRKLSAGEVATLPARTRSSNGVDAKAAPEVAELARRLAAPYPTDAAAQNELAEAEFDAKNYAAAEAAADRALAADPNSIHALLYKGMAQMAVAKAAGDTNPERWKAIRGYFLKANKLDTEYPQPLILFYESFAAAKQAPTVNARNGLLGAYVLAPFDTDLRVMAGKVLLETNDAKAARVAFEPVAYSPHAPADNVALKVLTALDEKGPEAALALLNEAEAKARKAAEDVEKKKKS